MDIVKIVEEKMSQNSYLIVEGEDAILIDAGATPAQIEENLQVFPKKPLLRAVLLTHCHFDHIRYLDDIIKHFKVPAYIFDAGKDMLFDSDKNLSYMESPFIIKNKKQIRTFLDGESLEFGNIKVECFNTPGHSIDSSCFKVLDNLFTGDTVFKMGAGRTDMFSGNANVLAISLERILNTISADTSHIYAGHGVNFDKADLEYNIRRFLGE